MPVSSEIWCHIRPLWLVLFHRWAGFRPLVFTFCRIYKIEHVVRWRLLPHEVVFKIGSKTNLNEQKCRFLFISATKNLMKREYVWAFYLLFGPLCMIFSPYSLWPAEKNSEPSHVEATFLGERFSFRETQKPQSLQSCRSTLLKSWQCFVPSHPVRSYRIGPES